ncbi:MAG: PAS domain S-box protein [Spirochaetes bacterium]|nr:PAS domain S-box protein [Spirochaetota bacterium]
MSFNHVVPVLCAAAAAGLFIYAAVRIRRAKITRDESERRRTDAIRRASEQQWQTTFDAISDIVLLIDTDHRIININKSGAENIRLPREQILGRKCYELVHGTDTPLALCPCAKSRVSAVPEESEMEHEGRFYHLAAWPITDDGHITSFVHIVRDITGRKTAELALRENEEKFSKTFQNAPVLLSITEYATGIYIDVNEEAIRISGFSRDEIIGHKSDEIGWITREDRDRIVGEMRVRGCIAGMEMNFRAKDGHTVVGFVKGERITIGGRECLLTVTIDITAQRQAEEALQKSERRFSQLIRNSFDTVVILDADGMQRYVSDSVVRTLGYQPSEVTDIPVIRDLIHPDDQAKVEAAFRSIIATGQGGVQYRHRHKNGDWVHLEAWGTNQLDNPDIRGVVVNVRDITEHKRVEEELLRADKLQSLGVLASGIAHEVNQPLMAITMALDNLALRAADNPYTVDKVSALKGYARRITHIVEQIRSFAREQKNDDVSVFAVNDSIRNVLGMVGAQFSVQGIRVIERLDAAEPRVSGNLYRLEQVVLNLLTNARYAVEERSAGAASGYVKEITVTTAREGSDILLGVHDNGIGMTEQVRRSLFTPFFTTKPPGDGTGLGLSISFSIIKGMGGDITIESVPDSHSRFTVRLPAVNG